MNEKKLENKENKNMESKDKIAGLMPMENIGVVPMEMPKGIIPVDNVLGLKFKR